MGHLGSFMWFCFIRVGISKQHKSRFCSFCFGRVEKILKKKLFFFFRSILFSERSWPGSGVLQFCEYHIIDVLIENYGKKERKKERMKERKKERMKERKKENE